MLWLSQPLVLGRQVVTRCFERCHKKSKRPPNWLEFYFCQKADNLVSNRKTAYWNVLISKKRTFEKVKRKMDQRLEDLGRQRESAKQHLNTMIEAYEKVMESYDQDLQSKNDTITYLIEKISKLEDEKDVLEGEKEQLVKESEVVRLENARLSEGKFDARVLAGIDNVTAFESQMMNHYWTTLVESVQKHIKNFLNKSKEWKTVFENITKRIQRSNEELLKFLQFVNEFYDEWVKNPHMGFRVFNRSVFDYFPNNISIPILKFVIDNGFDFNSYEGSRFIHWACETGQIAVVEALLPSAVRGDFKINYVHPEHLLETQARLKFSKTDDIFHDPLSHACLGHFRIAKMFLENAQKLGLTLDKVYSTKKGESGTILYQAAKLHLFEVVKLILEVFKDSGEIHGAKEAIKFAILYFDFKLLKLYIEYAKEIPAFAQTFLEVWINFTWHSEDLLYPNAQEKKSMVKEMISELRTWLENQRENERSSPGDT